MNEPGKIIAGAVVSVSMAIVATHAMAAVGKDSQTVIALDSVEADLELQAKIDAAVAKRDVRQAVAEAFSVLATSFGDDNQSLSAKYFKDAAGQVAVNHGLVDSKHFESANPGVTPNCYSNCHGACYQNCHDACHSACHGSRSWR